MSEPAESINGFGQTLSIGALGDTPSFAALVKLRDVTGPDTSVDALDATHAGSTSAEYIPGLLDNGELSANLLYDATQTTTLRGYLKAKKAFKFTLSDGASYTFDGIITKLGVASPYKDMVTQDITVKVSGDVTFAASAA